MSKSLLMIARPPGVLQPHQKIALAVVTQAFADAADRHISDAVRAEARAFIADSAMLREWCAVAGLDPAFVRDVNGRFLRGFFRIVSNPPISNGRPRQRHTRERVVARTPALGGWQPNAPTRATPVRVSRVQADPASVVSLAAVSRRGTSE